MDIPGYSAAIVSYPELRLSARPLSEVPVSFNDSAVFDPTGEDTCQFLDGVLTELAALFPGGMIHIGGDEAWGRKCREGDRNIGRVVQRKGNPVIISE